MLQGFHVPVTMERYKKKCAALVLVWFVSSFALIIFLPVNTGGCAAQEVIKLITKQYVPLDNTFIFNSVTTTTATLRL